VLKKVAIAGAATAVALLTVGGVAYADSSADPNCSSHETTKQKSKTLIGGNVIGRDINGFIGGSIDKPGVCPSAQERHAPWQAFSQHTPSTQKPLRHSPPAVQGCPWPFLPQLLVAGSHA